MAVGLINSAFFSRWGMDQVEEARCTGWGIDFFKIITRRFCLKRQRERERERERGRVSSVLLSIDLKNCDAIAATEETVWCFRDIRACREMLRVLKAPFVRARWKDGGTEDLLT